MLPLLASPDATVRLYALETVIGFGDPAAAAQVEKVYEQELKGVQALRADWVSVELPKQFEPGFEPSARKDLPPDPAVAATQAKHDELFSRLKELNEARARQAPAPSPSR